MNLLFKMWDTGRVYFCLALTLGQSELSYSEKFVSGFGFAFCDNYFLFFLKLNNWWLRLFSQLWPKHKNALWKGSHQFLGSQGVTEIQKAVGEMLGSRNRCLSFSENVQWLWALSRAQYWYSARLAEVNWGDWISNGKPEICREVCIQTSHAPNGTNLLFLQGKY